MNYSQPQTLRGSRAGMGTIDQNLKFGGISHSEITLLSTAPITTPKSPSPSILYVGLKVYRVYPRRFLSNWPELALHRKA